MKTAAIILNENLSKNNSESVLTRKKTIEVIIDSMEEYADQFKPQNQAEGEKQIFDLADQFDLHVEIF